MKKKKVLLISGGLLTLILIIISIVLITNNKDEKIYATNKRKENLNDFLTLMLEQSDGTYQESTSNTWPGDGYIFNKELSSCQNGGELDYDSENNKVILYSNKSDGCYVYFDIYNKPIINSINLGEVTNNSITITVSATNGTNPISNYYYIINNETPVSTTSNTYTFSGLSAGQIYTIKVYAVDTEGFSSDTSSLSVETESIVYLADYIKNTVYQGDGVNGLYYHDGQGSYTNSDQEAGDNSYRYAGANPNNYVCFGSTASVCPLDNLYRIIGVFDEKAKLIKADYANSYLFGTNGGYSGYMFNSNSFSNYSGYLSEIYSYYWNSNTINNVWIESNLNTINLNMNYLNNIGSTWSNLIETHEWKVGGGNSTYLYNGTMQVAYNYEVGSNSSSTTYNAKIGLMYVSDYGYATSSNNWTQRLNYSLYNNWLYMGVKEWTISRNSVNESYVFIINTDRRIAYTGSGSTDLSFRPTFYLNPDVEYASGSGTESDPIRLKID